LVFVKKKIFRGQLDEHYKENPLEHIKLALEENIRLQTTLDEIQTNYKDLTLGIEQLTELKPKLIFNPLHSVNIPMILPSFLVMEEWYNRVAFITGDNWNIAGIKSNRPNSLFSCHTGDKTSVNVRIT